MTESDALPSPLYTEFTQKLNKNIKKIINKKQTIQLILMTNVHLHRPLKNINSIVSTIRTLSNRTC